MKYPCGVIRDILPLYKDEVCSEESRGAVEEHLSECKDCSEYYERLSEDREKIPNPEIEDHKADSLRAVRKRIRRSVTAAMILAAAILVVCMMLGAAMIMMSEKRTIEYNGGNISVSMRPEGLIATVRGAEYSGSHVKSVFTADGKMLKIFRLEESEWGAFISGKNTVSEFTIAFADTDAGKVDAVYYYSGALNDDSFRGMEELPAEELDKLLGEMTVLWERE